MRLPTHLADEALDLATDKCIHIEDKEARGGAIRREAVQAGAEVAFSLVAKWLAVTAPEVHRAFLAEFKSPMDRA